ncbi:site-specific DNA-methyltransferase [Pigmentibacter sp. JX0631]|uniref:site-specific DNA-methyltransferase n=1 Tax=Pigmentibacter sp. JX0631 TaxID=2976982 RepID=UPI0024688771|nr:site-specific DNA-methyltransferase [Pigmentibacter sp. JX0631]WGL58788.1 site-specific DNA-methyltransferase [Pigmentibacter sp. JX0631]
MSEFWIESPLNNFSLNLNRNNYLIEGDNLPVLQALSSLYTNKIKLIYIDPPYNTKQKFIYNDNFGNHNSWCDMMRPRLDLAYRLLANDGFIFISIDDNEVHYLRLLMDEIFGCENFRNCIVVPRGIKNVQAQFSTARNLSIGHEYILFYSKNKETRIKKFELLNKNNLKCYGSWNNHWRGTNRPNLRYELFGITPKAGQWRWSKERSFQAIENYKKILSDCKKKNSEDLSQEEIWKWYKKNINEKVKFDLLRLSKLGKPEHFIPPNNYILGSDLWSDLKASGSRDLKKILEYGKFDMPKSVALIKRIISICTLPNTNDIILDFFAGSGTTAQAVLEKNIEDNGNRQFILVQSSEKISNLINKNVSINNIAELAKVRIEKFLQLNDSKDSKKFIYVQFIPNEINSSSPAGVAGAGLTPSSKPPMMNDI